MPIEPHRADRPLSHVVPVAVVPAMRLGNGRDGHARYRETGGCLGAAKLLAIAAAGYAVVERANEFCWSLNRPFSAVIEASDGSTYLAIFRGDRDPASRHEAPAFGLGARARARA